MTREDVLGVVRDSLAVVCDRSPDTIGDATVLGELGADSLARVALAELVEQHLATAAPTLHIDDKNLAAFITVGDVADYVAARL